jgi:ParB family chromosome partitioning protein
MRKTKTAAATQSSATQFVSDMPINVIAPSPTNPRKHMDAAQLEELAASIKEKGLIQPIVVRPKPGKKGVTHELIAGERRWRACQLAGLKTAPVIVRDLDDRETLEVQVIENLQRSDVHPLEEAEGYQRLMSDHGYTAEVIAAKVGKSEAYVYGRIKLASLITPAKKLFLAGDINAGHAILIARLSKDEQKEVVDGDDENGFNGLLWADEMGVADKDRFAVSVRVLGQRIKDQLYLDLARAPWKQNDTKLVPAAGPCTTCPKRTGANPGLFAEIAEKNICTDRKCYAGKLDAFINRTIEDGGLLRISTKYQGGNADAGVLGPREYEQIWDGDNNRCKFAQKAIVVEGNDRGATKQICIEKTCKKHHAFESTGRGVDDYRAQQRNADKKRRIEIERRRRIYLGALDLAPLVPTRADLEVVAKAAWKRLMAETQKTVMKLQGLEPKKSGYSWDCETPVFKFLEGATDLELFKFMMATALGGDLSVYTYGNDRPAFLLEVAKRWGVDVDGITKDVKAEAKAKGKKTRKAQTSAVDDRQDDDPEYAEGIDDLEQEAANVYD